jgi:hypothetical protein
MEKAVRKPVICWLSRQADGKYALLQKKPTIENVGNTDHQELYITYGDGIGYRNMCEWSADAIWDVKDLPFLNSVKVWFIGGELNKVKPGFIEALIKLLEEHSYG